VSGEPQRAQATVPPREEARPARIDEVLGRAEARPGSVWRRRVLPGAVVVLALGGAVYALARPGETAATEWILGEVTRGDLRVAVTATGTVEPTEEVEISSELSGRVGAVHVDFNDRGRTGQVLAELDTDRLEASAAVSSAALASRRARVLEAEATVTERTQELERVERLIARDARSAQDLDAARAAYQRALAALTSAEAEVAVAEADLRLKRTDLAKARITSPIDGVVLRRGVDPGQTVAASLQAPELFRLAEDLRRMELQVDVDEADVGVTEVGQAATFTVDAYPDRTFPAVLRQLRLAPETAAGVVTYKAILAIDNRELLLRPGMTATAEVTVERVEGALLVPNEALRFAPPAGEEEERGLLDALLPGPRRFRRAARSDAPGPRVWVLRDGAPVAVPVELGPSDGDRTVVRSGALEAGQPVVVDARERR